jgi:hypothetical protein
VYLIHDIEEILTVEAFLEEHHQKIPFSITTLEFTVAFVFLFIISTVGCYRGLKNKKFIGMLPTQFFIVLVPGFLLANGVGHVLQFIYFRSYVPGIYTTLVIIFPYCFFSLRFLFKHKILSKTKFLFIFLSAFILQAPLAFIALLLGEILV